MPQPQKLSESFSDRITIDNQIDPAGDQAALEELRRGLAESPKRIPTRYLYDRRGSELFEEITRLPEYYPTRAERTILEQEAAHIQEISQCHQLLELGAGAATKTRVLLDAMQNAGTLEMYIPLDVSESEVGRVAEELVAEYPGLRVHGIVADFVQHLAVVPPGQNRLNLLLGGTIGNFSSEAAVELLQRIGKQMDDCDFFLLGADLIKDVSIIEAAYNDSRGVTAEFNRNILRVVNRFAQADFEPDRFDHLAFFNREFHRIEMHLVASEAMEVIVGALDLQFEVDAGEALFTEISCKYDRPMVESMLLRAGFDLTDWFTDPNEYFALALAQKRC